MTLEDARIKNNSAVQRVNERQVIAFHDVGFPAVKQASDVAVSVCAVVLRRRDIRLQ
jgi:hypothetical protein